MVIALLVVISFLGSIILYIFVSGPKLSPETEAIIDNVLNNELPEFIIGETGYAACGDLKIWYESISPQGTPKGTILLLMATGGAALFWPPEFIRSFLDSGYQVVRYDHRGTGLSDWMENWDSKQPYSIADMAGDAAAVLDALGIQTAHLIGLSMGGMVAQEFALQYMNRVVTLTLIMTSGFIGDPELPGLTSSYFFRSLFKGLPLLKYRLMGGEKNLIRERIAKQVQFVGNDGFDIKEAAEIVLYDLRNRRGINIKGVFQHQAAIRISGSRYEGLKSVDIPTLVIHGTADPIIPIGHGKKLAQVIPNARGLWLEGVEHVFLLPDMELVVQEVRSHLDSKLSPR